MTHLDGLDAQNEGKGGGERLNQSQRANLLMKLASSANMEVPEQTRKAAAQTVRAVSASTRAPPTSGRRTRPRLH